MENYIIRVYRRDKSNPEEMVGFVQNVLSDKIQPFKHIDELVEMLIKPEVFCQQNQKKSQGGTAGRRDNENIKQGRSDHEDEK